MLPHYLPWLEINLMYNLKTKVWKKVRIGAIFDERSCEKHDCL